MNGAVSCASSSATSEQQRFYRRVLEELHQCQTPYLVGGGYALAQYSEIARESKDLDLLVLPTDAAAVLRCMSERGYRTELCFPHWLAKVIGEKYFVDIIFSSGNGVCEVDSGWFEFAVPGEILGVQVGLCAPEEMIWSKSFVMERERYDGADVAHLIRARGEQLDWRRLLRRFGEHWHVLLSHLILFGFIYPSERSAVPSWVMRELLDRLQSEAETESTGDRTCRGTLLSRSQYRWDLDIWGYRDARHLPCGFMTPEEAASWSAAGEESNTLRR